MLTVTTPATDRNLLTTAEIRYAVGVSDASQDDALGVLNRRIASAFSRLYTNASGSTPVTLRLETITETFRDVCASHLWLSRAPVTSITSVVSDGTTLDAADYEIDGRRLYSLSDDARVWWSSAKVVVVYDAGWDTVPDEIKLAASKMARLLWSEGGDSGRSDPNLKRVRIEGVGEREWWVGGASDPLMSQEIQELLAPFREMVV